METRHFYYAVPYLEPSLYVRCTARHPTCVVDCVICVCRAVRGDWQRVRGESRRVCALLHRVFRAFQHRWAGAGNDCMQVWEAIIVQIVACRQHSASHGVVSLETVDDPQ